MRLDGIDCTKEAIHFSEFPELSQLCFYSPRFSINSDNAATPGWEMASADLFDSAGNSGFYLDPSDSAWRVRVTIRPSLHRRGPNDAVAASTNSGLRVRTADGKETAVKEFHGTGSVRFFPLPKNLTGEFTFELVLQRSETVEFFVAPPKER